jgi:hypothetical protein
MPNRNHASLTVSSEYGKESIYSAGLVSSAVAAGAGASVAGSLASGAASVVVSASDEVQRVCVEC